MPWGGNLPDLLQETRQQRRRERRAPTIPFAPTPKGRAAAREWKQERAETHNRRLHQGKVPQPLPPVEDDGPSFVDALTSIAVSPAGTLLGGTDNPISSTVKDFAEDEAKRSSSNLVDVLQENYPGVFGGEGPASLPGQDLVPSSNELELAADVGLIVGPEAIGLRTASRAGGRAAELLRTSQKTVEAGEATSRAARALAGGPGPSRGLVGRAVAKTEPAVVRQARELAVQRAGTAAQKIPAPVRTAGKVAGRTAALPVKRPLTAPIAAQAPAFAASGGDPKELLEALEGKGTFATASASLADAASDLSPVLGEAVNLPATVLPSTFLAGKAGVSAARGDTSELDSLWDEYQKTGVLPAVAAGDLEEAKQRFGEHPLFSAAERSKFRAAVQARIAPRSPWRRSQ